MVSLLYLMSYFIPPASDCYLSPGVIDPKNHEALRAIARSIADDNSISITQAESALSCIQYFEKQKVVDQVAARVTPYCQYQKNFLDPYRIKQGVLFFKTHQKTLQKAAEQYAVDPYIITAIIGVETNYGKILGQYLVKDALINNLLNIPSSLVGRKNFFLGEVKALISLSLKNDVDLNTLKGSHAGAFGIAQFMPSSYLHNAVSEKHTAPNLFDPEDAIISIANYLVKQGHWQPGAIAKEIQSSPSLLQALDADISYTHSIHQNTERWIYHTMINGSTKMTWAVDHEKGLFNGKPLITSADYQHKKVYRFTLNDGSDIFWATEPNFEAIKSYNIRPHYAINVYLLARAIHDHINAE